MTDQEIKDRVNVIASAYVKSIKMTSEDAAVYSAGVDLIVNILQNINTIAKER